MGISWLTTGWKTDENIRRTNHRHQGRRHEISCEFDYAKPDTLRDALGLLARHAPHGAVPLAGGTDLVAWLRDGAVSPGFLVDIKELAELRGIRRKAGHLWLGANTTFAEIMASPLVRRHAPILAEAAGMVASVGVRNHDRREYLLRCSLLRAGRRAGADAVIHVATLAGPGGFRSGNGFSIRARRL